MLHINAVAKEHTQAEATENCTLINLRFASMLISSTFVIPKGFLGDLLLSEQFLPVHL